MGCPCCSPTALMIPCPECNGVGHTFYNEEGEIIKEEEYNQLPHNRRDKEPCDYCEGLGEIEENYEPDYDNYDE